MYTMKQIIKRNLCNCVNWSWSYNGQFGTCFFLNNKNKNNYNKYNWTCSVYLDDGKLQGKWCLCFCLEGACHWRALCCTARTFWDWNLKFHSYILLYIYIFGGESLRCRKFFLPIGFSQTTINLGLMHWNVNNNLQALQTGATHWHGDF